MLLSGRGEEEAQRAEAELRASGADWTIVRCSWFSQNFSEDHLREPVLAGEVALPVGDVPEPFVDADDIADVAVAALTEDGHAGELYELTGPRLLTFADAVGEIARRHGARHPLHAGHARTPTPAELAGHGVPRRRRLAAALPVHRGPRRPQRAPRRRRRSARCGRPPRDFRDFARRAAGRTGAWSAA